MTTHNVMVVVLFLLLLGGCASDSALQLNKAADQARRFSVQGESFVRDTMSIDGCPTGFKPSGVRIGTGSNADLRDVDGDVDYYLSTGGARGQRCIRE